MWIAEHGIETAVSPEAIWRQWADVAGWPEWNRDIERIEINGPFAAGSRITMTPFGQHPIELRIAETAEPRLFVDEADLGEVVVRTIHRAKRLETGQTQISYRMEISGPAAATLGPRDRTADQRRRPAATRRARRSRQFRRTQLLTNRSESDVHVRA
jgi:hypothetical protein